MFKALLASSVLASSLLLGGLTLPAAADGIDFRIVGGVPYGAAEAAPADWNGGGWNGEGGPRPGWGRGSDGGDGYGAPQRDWRLPPWQLARSLRHRGYYDVEILRERRDVTIVRAAARGRDVILVVDARSGDVLRQRPADGWGQGRGWHGGWGQDWRRW